MVGKFSLITVGLNEQVSVALIHFVEKDKINHVCSKFSVCCIVKETTYVYYDDCFAVIV